MYVYMLCMCIYIYIYMCVCICIYIYIYIYTYVCVFICICLFVRGRVCVCVDAYRISEYLLAQRLAKCHWSSLVLHSAHLTSANRPFFFGTLIIYLCNKPCETERFAEYTVKTRKQIPSLAGHRALSCFHVQEFLEKVAPEEKKENRLGCGLRL